MLFDLKDVTSSFIDHFVHQVDQVALLVGLLVLLSECLNCIVNEVFQGLRSCAAIVASFMKVLKELPHVFFAFNISVGLVQELEHRNQGLQALLDDLLLQFAVEEEFLEDLDGYR